MGKADTKSTTRNNRIICLPFSQEVYNVNIKNPIDFRKCINERIELFPELFPPEITEGYLSLYKAVRIYSARRIEIAGISYSIRPSFLMPYMTGITDETEKALFMRKFNVPFWTLSYVFGKGPMYWYRIEQSLGRNSYCWDKDQKS